MSTTPKRGAERNLTQDLTPVRYLDDGLNRENRSPANGSNFTVCKSRLETIVKTLQDNYTKWQLAQKRGAALCNCIDVIKTRALEEKNKPCATNILYPIELQPHCDKLAIITSIFVDITKNASESLKQLRSLSKLPGICGEIFYRSWKIAEFVRFVEQVLMCYETETSLKSKIMEEIAHCTTKAELIESVTLWEYPQLVDEWIMFKFTLLAEELKTIKM